MNIYFQFALFVGAFATLVGAVAYFAEFNRGRVSMRTRWSDLDLYQWIAVSFALGGAVLLIASLILGATTKGM
jgi:hypothetical protein